MIRLEPKKPYAEFAIGETVFKIDFSTASQYRFSRQWPSLETKMTKALDGVIKTSEEIKALSDTPKDKIEDEKFAEFDKLAEERQKKIDEFIEACKEIINLRLPDEPFDKIFELCYGDMRNLTEVILTITKIIKEQGE